MQESSSITPLNTPAQPKTYVEEPQIVENQVHAPTEAVLGNSNIAVPFSQYEQVKNTKYTVDYFGIPDVFKMIDNRLDKYSIKDNVLKIEDFVGSEIGRNNLEDSTDSYGKVIDDILMNIGKVQNELPQVTIWRIGNYLDYLTKQAELEKLKPMFQHAK
jgi:hypothetical protein